MQGWKCFGGREEGKTFIMVLVTLRMSMWTPPIEAFTPQADVVALGMFSTLGPAILGRL